MLAAYPMGADGYVRVRQTFSPAWLGFCLGRCGLLPLHVRTADGLDAWWVTGPGTLYVSNSIVVAELLAMLASLACVLLAAFTPQRVTRPPGV